MTRRALSFCLALLGSLILSLGQNSGLAQTPAPDQTAAQEETLLIPHYDAGGAPENAAARRATAAIRFVALRDDPPFAFERRGLALGLYLDVVRAVCGEIGATCVIDLLPQEALFTEPLGPNDVIIATVADTKSLDARFRFSQPILQNTGRFLVKTDSPLNRAWPEDLAGLKLGVLDTAPLPDFTEAELKLPVAKVFSTFAAAVEALEKGEIDALFTDGVRANYFLTTEEASCCKLLPGAYHDPSYFNETARLIVREGNNALLQDVASGLDTLTSNPAKWGEIYLKYFPFGLY